MSKSHLIWVVALAAFSVDITLAALKKFKIAVPGL